MLQKALCQINIHDDDKHCLWDNVKTILDVQYSILHIRLEGYAVTQTNSINSKSSHISTLHTDHNYDVSPRLLCWGTVSRVLKVSLTGWYKKTKKNWQEITWMFQGAQDSCTCTYWIQSVMDRHMTHEWQGNGEEIPTCQPASIDDTKIFATYYMYSLSVYL